VLCRGRALFAIALVCRSAVTSGCSRSVNARDSKTTVVRLVLNGADPDLTTELNESVAILPDPPSDPQELAKAYRSAVGSTDRVRVDSAHHWMVVVAGPLLDSPDQAVVEKAELDGGVFRIEAVYTSIRLRGGALFRNLAWRPLLTMPIDPGLPPGVYWVEVAWQPLESLPSGRPLANPHFIGPLPFTVQR
jgi:hypothetical protein